MKPEMLTPSELESLRQKARENNAYFKKAFSDSPTSETLTPSERDELTRKANEDDDHGKKVFAHLRPKP